MQSLKTKQSKHHLGRLGIFLAALFLCLPGHSHPHHKKAKKKTSSWQLPLLCTPFKRSRHRFYLGAGLLDQGRAISATFVEKDCAYGYVHKVVGFKDEHYISDSVHYSLKINTTPKYSIFAGGSAGFEQHDDSQYFAKSYVILQPRISLWKRYSQYLALGTDVELGKTFWAIKHNKKVSAPARKFEPRPQVRIGINLKLN